MTKRPKIIQKATTCTIEAHIIGNPILGSLKLNYLRSKLASRKMLRVEEVIEILKGISAEIYFKKADPEKGTIMFDSLSIDLTDELRRI